MIASNPNGEAPLLQALTYELPAPSTAIVDRKQSVRAYPTSASSLSMNNVRTARIRIGGEGFVDPSSMRVMFTINNTGTGHLAFNTGPWGVWQQGFLRSNGVQLDDVPYLGRHMHQYHWAQLPLMDQIAVGNEGLGSSKLLPNMTMDWADIAPGQSITVMHRLPFSLCSSSKLLPVKYAPLEVELSCITNILDWCDPIGAVGGFTQTFQLENVQILYDDYTLDEAVLAGFYSALLRNKVLSIGTMSFHQTVHPIPGGATSLNLTSVRAYSRLASVWLTFRNTGGRNYQFVCPGPLPGNADVNLVDLQNTAVPQARLSIASHNWPDPQFITTAGEYHMMLTKALGYSPNISRKFFEDSAFTIAWDIKKNPGDPTSAISTRSGDQILVQLQNLTANSATECWMTVFYFSVCAIRESGVSLLT